YQLRVPAGKKPQFEERYAQVPEGKRANYLRHRIVQGDTLGAIAKKYRIRVADIISLNKIQNPRALRIGRDLILPLHENYSSLPLEEMEDDYIRTRKKTYRVRSGDSLWSIARRFQVSEKELRVWNKLGWSNVIRPGQTLVVSRQSVRTAANRNSRSAAGSSAKSSRKIVYQVQSGDTLWDISRKHSVPLTDIRKWNNLKENHILRPGDKLTLTVGNEYSG
ncbi:MAG: LysM peptidoglycan-binding domain-containing protein, partial [Desulfuromonadaceae bacterium]